MPKKSTTDTKTYQQARHELNEILVAMQRDDIDVDAAVAHYEHGLILIKHLQNHLETATNKITTLQSKI